MTWPGFYSINPRKPVYVIFTARRVILGSRNILPSMRGEFIEFHHLRHICVHRRGQDCSLTGVHFTFRRLWEMYIIPEGSCLLGRFILARRSRQLTPGSKSARSSCDCLLREAMAYPDVSVSKIQVMYRGQDQWDERENGWLYRW